jgi:dihydroorotate dehydrogenase (fumarate)
VNLSTNYLGLALRNPLMMGASPLAQDVDELLRAEDAGVSAVVMNSLFEEQLTHDQLAHFQYVEAHAHTHAEALSLQPLHPSLYRLLGPDEYLQQIAHIKRRVNLPVLGSLNGVTDQGWLRYARQIEQAGADGLELNVYYLATDAQQSGAQVEQQLVDMVHSVTHAVSIPVAVKLSPFYSSLVHLAGRLVEAGARGLVLFNRFYEPDIDVETLALEPRLQLSNSSELLLRLRWLAALSDQTPASLAVSGGVHNALDALKAVMAGAHAVQLVSVLLAHGPGVVTGMLAELEGWLEEHEYESLSQACGSMNLARCPDPTYYHRGNYLRILQSFRRGSERRPIHALHAPSARAAADLAPRARSDRRD